LLTVLHVDKTVVKRAVFLLIDVENYLSAGLFFVFGDWKEAGLQFLSFF